MNKRSSKILFSLLGHFQRGNGPSGFSRLMFVVGAVLLLAFFLTTQSSAQDPASQQMLEKAVQKNEQSTDNQEQGSDSAGETPQEQASSAAQAQDQSFVEKLDNQLGSFADKYPVVGVLHFIFFEMSIQVENQKINLAKLFLAIVIILIGLRYSRLLAEGTQKRILTRFRVDRQYSYFLKNLVHFTLFVIICLLALDIAGIPITVFAFLGGAIAIAVGFGGQEMLANFISGLILMIEEPIRPNDLIEFDGDQGKVAYIGPRFTRLTMPGNVDLLVPNRKLIENKLTNWTLDDEKVRTEVVVGIAYGSPTRQAADLILKAVRQHEKVETTPEPVVMFEEFGDNSLVFRVFFWVSVSSFLDQRIIQSDIRFVIDDYFREADITIAFPQRDVHLDSLSPVEVRVVRDGEKD